jgi:hypothetical protein
MYEFLICLYVTNIWGITAMLVSGNYGLNPKLRTDIQCLLYLCYNQDRISCEML